MAMFGLGSIEWTSKSKALLLCRAKEHHPVLWSSL
jgi:hypothetical protein